MAGGDDLADIVLDLLEMEFGLLDGSPVQALEQERDRADNLARELTSLRAELDAFTRSGGRAACIGQDLLGIDTVLPENRAGAEALASALSVPANSVTPPFAVVVAARIVGASFVPVTVT